MPISSSARFVPNECPISVGDASQPPAATPPLVGPSSPHAVLKASTPCDFPATHAKIRQPRELRHAQDPPAPRTRPASRRGPKTQRRQSKSAIVPAAEGLLCLARCGHKSPEAPFGAEN